MDFILSLLGIVISVLATSVYYDHRRFAKYGFSRILSFFLGFPWTLIVLMVVSSGRDRELITSKELDRRALTGLQAEIEQDRRTRIDDSRHSHGDAANGNSP